MSSLFFVIFALLLVVGFLLVSKGKGASSSGKVGYPYQLTKQLFSPAERSFMGVLDQAVGRDYRVFGKVRVADIAAVKPGLSNSARQGALNKIAAKHFDYVVCAASDLTVLCAIELNDKSHASKRARSRDEFMAKLCDVIGLQLVTFPAKASYSVAEVKATLAQAIPALSDGIAARKPEPVVESKGV